MGQKKLHAPVARYNGLYSFNSIKSSRYIQISSSRIEKNTSKNTSKEKSRRQAVALNVNVENCFWGNAYTEGRQ